MSQVLYSVAAAVVLSMPLAAQPPAGPVGGHIDDPPAGKAGPAPRFSDSHPDLGNGKGVWNPRIVANIAGVGPGGPRRSPVEKIVDVPFQPWAKKVYEERLATLSKDDPEGLCLPPGIPRMMATPFPFQIYQVPGRVIFLFEGGAHMWRVIYTDGRSHPKDPNPTYLGDSIGRWEGDTLLWMWSDSMTALGLTRMATLTPKPCTS
jgi:hypothetical protein